MPTPTCPAGPGESVLPNWNAARRARGFGRQQRIDDDPAALALDQRHHRDVVTAQLIEAGFQLEQAVDAVELGVPPQGRIDRGRCGAVEE
jgi:hypothetical protein